MHLSQHRNTLPLCIGAVPLGWFVCHFVSTSGGRIGSMPQRTSARIVVEVNCDQHGSSSDFTNLSDTHSRILCHRCSGVSSTLSQRFFPLTFSNE